MNVTIIQENRHLVAEHVELEHPLAAGDIIVYGIHSYEVLRSQQTLVRVGSLKLKPVGKVVSTEIVVKLLEEE